MTTCRNCQTRLTPDDSFCRKCGQVVFADENLEATVRRELKKPLTRAAIRELTELDPFGTEIEYLLGLDSAVNLTRLNLGWNQISDVSPLASLTNLTWLHLNGNQISDVSPLVSLSSLTVLNLTSNDVNDVNPLTSLNNLRHLFLSDNPLSRDSKHRHIPKLKEKGVDVRLRL